VTYLLGTALVRDGEVRKGQQVIDRILKHGESAEANLLIGSLELAAGRYTEALATLQKAEGLNPKLPGLQALLGRARMENDDADGAKAAFAKELDADSADFDSNLHLGALLRIENSFDEAGKYIRRALQVRPDSVAARFQLGSIHLARGELAQAVEVLERVVKDSPEFLEAHVQLASAYYKVGRKEDGQRERQIVLKLNEENRKRDLEQR
jgi:tetratricopeptide (TPR) repeat protein